MQHCLQKTASKFWQSPHCKLYCHSIQSVTRRTSGIAKMSPQPQGVAQFVLAHKHARAHTHTHTHTYTLIYTRTHTRTHTHTHILTHEHIHTGIHTHIRLM